MIELGEKKKLRANQLQKVRDHINVLTQNQQDLTTQKRKAPTKKGKTISLTPVCKYVFDKGKRRFCALCSMKCASADALEAHVTSKHLGDDIQECPFPTEAQKKCGKHFATYDECVWHVMCEHHDTEAACSKCDSTEEGHFCPISPKNLVGERICVRWVIEKHRLWCAAKVLSYDDAHLTHTVVYDDGVEKTEDLTEVDWRFLS